MKLLLKNTINGLIPMYDDDFNEKKKLKLFETYTAEVRVARNIDFHRKYFALLNIGWEYMNDKQVAFYNNSKYGFRKSVQIAAGACEKVWSIKRQEWVEDSISISFDKMDEIEFRELYTNVRNVIFSLIEGNVSEEEFINNLADF
ncbi:MAG: DUF1367 family protein [Paludibacter sp.]